MSKETSLPKKGRRGKLMILLLLLLGVAAFYYFDLGQYATLDALKGNKEALQAYTQSNYGLTAFLFMLIYAGQTALSLPGATIMTLAGGLLFGTFAGAFFVNIGATTGATLACLAGRTLLRDSIEKKFGPRLESIQKGFSNNAFSYLLTLRLIPLFPFFLVNLASGLTRIKISTYILATAIGILPGSLVYTNAGKQLATINSLKDIASPGVLGAFALLGLLAMGPILYNKIKQTKK